MTSSLDPGRICRPLGVVKAASWRTDTPRSRHASAEDDFDFSSSIGRFEHSGVGAGPLPAWLTPRP